MLGLIIWKLGYSILGFLKKITGNRGSRVWYFAYGANVDPDTLECRGIDVFEEVPYLLKDYKITFTHPSRWKGHGFADIERATGQEVFGKLYLISNWDQWRMDFLELAVIFNRHKKTYVEENGRKIYFYQGTDSLPDVKPLRAYFEAIQNAYQQSGLKSTSYEKEMQKVQTLDLLPTEWKDYAFIQPSKFCPLILTRAYDQFVGRTLILLYPHKMIGVRKRKQPIVK